MSLPEQIQKQVNEATSIIEQHYGKPAQGEAPNADEPAAPDLPAPDDAAEGDAPASPVAVAPPVVDEEKTFEQRWRSLQGIYNTTTQQLRSQEARVRQLEELLGSLQSQSAAPAPAPASFLTEKDEESFGADQIDMVRRAAREEINPLLSHIEFLKKEISALKGLTPVVSTLVTNQRGTASENFFGALRKAVPEWETINADERFHGWLLSPDPLSGITRQTYLEDAHRSFDAPRVINIFSMWKQLSTPTESTLTPERASPNAAASELELQIAPGRQTAAAAPTSPDKRQWLTTDISKFYDDVRRGLYKGRDAERAETERDIFLAQREGRVVRAAA